MIAKTCVHPIKVNRIINDFVNAASGKMFTIRSSRDDSMNYFVGDNEIIVPRWRTANYKNDIGGKLFRKDFEKRCPLARGFSDVTISILHEIGHRMTDKEIPRDFRRWEALKEIEKQAKTTEEKCFLYFSITDEILATNWAINWLSNAENRKTAKAFEKRFWACFE